MFTIWTDDVILSCQKIGGTHKLVCVIFIHACIQSDPGGPNSWIEVLDGTECE